LKAQLLAICVILITVSACDETMAADVGVGFGGGAALPLGGLNQPQMMAMPTTKIKAVTV
jgi:hypothetical protein